MLLRQASSSSLRDTIVGTLEKNGIRDEAYVQMLDYVVGLFEAQNLGADYYGYHNVTHELEVTYVSAIAALADPEMDGADARHMYAAALFHDFDPKKDVDKPQEEEVIGFIAGDDTTRKMLSSAGLDLGTIKALILRTAYPWEGTLKTSTMRVINECLPKNADKEKTMRDGWFLSIADRISGYALGGFPKGIEMAKKNAHALGWHPALLAQRAVAYFERLLNEESEMFQHVVSLLPKQMRHNVMDNVIGFMDLRQKEIRIRADYLYENFKLVPVIEKMDMRRDPEFVASIRGIYDELPAPLQFGSDHFEESMSSQDTILTTLRHGSASGKVIGYAKGGPLESYKLRSEITDENYGKSNTVFLEPLALKMGYWGLSGGSEMRNMFALQAHAKKYAYLTSFSYRDIIQKRVDGQDEVEFVARFDPERWDYYRMRI